MNFNILTPQDQTGYLKLTPVILTILFVILKLKVELKSQGVHSLHLRVPLRHIHNCLLINHKILCLKCTKYIDTSC